MPDGYYKTQLFLLKEELIETEKLLKKSLKAQALTEKTVMARVNRKMVLMKFLCVILFVCLALSLSK